MKKLVGLFCLSALLYSCNTCDIVRDYNAYLQFYMNEPDTLQHPINSNQLMRVFTYYPNGNWDQAHLIDSNKIITLNWYRVQKNDTAKFYMELDKGLTPNRIDSEFTTYDYWLKSISGDLQIKISKAKIKNTPKTKKCDGEHSVFEACTINDSLHTFSEPIKLW